MNAPVHILATVRRPELLPAALLVFRTLRTGFPEALVNVWGNALPADAAQAVAAAAGHVGATFHNLPDTAHDAWLENIINTAVVPFWICDTDMVFFDRVSEPAGHVNFAGRFEPEFDEEFTDTLHVARLHTALMFINPMNLRCAIRAWMGRIPEPCHDSATFPLVRQNFVPNTQPGKTLFYDTMAGAYHALPGTSFTQEQDAAFEHLHCATYALEVAGGAPSLKDLPAVHEQIYADPQRARGLKAAQDAYYRQRQPHKKYEQPMD